MNNKSFQKPLIIVFSNLGLGGIQRKIVDIVNFIHKKNISIPIYIILRKEDDYSISQEIKNPQVHIRIYQKTHTKRAAFGFTFFVLYQIMSLHPQSVLSFLSPFSIPVLIAKICIFWRKCTLVISQDHFTSNMMDTLRYPLLNTIGLWFFYRFADTIITPSEGSRNDLITTYSIPPSLAVTVRNWTKIPPMLEYKKTIDIISISRFVKGKQLFIFLEAIKELSDRGYKNIKVKLIGDGPEKSRYALYIQKHGLKQIISILPPQKNTDRLYNRAKIFVCTSPYNHEGFPLTVLEAMAHGAAVITTDFGSTREVITHGDNGFIVQNQTELVDSIILLLENNKKRRLIAKSAYTYIRKHHTDTLINKYIHYLHLL